MHAITCEDWVAEIEKVHDNLDYFRQVGIDNYEDFTKHYTVESNSQTYIALFNQLKK